MSRTIPKREALLKLVRDAAWQLDCLKKSIELAPKNPNVSTDCITPSASLRIALGDVRTRFTEIERLLK